MSKAEEAWSRAAICVDRAQAARSDETRRFFNKLRDSWVRAANTHQLAESLEADIKAPGAGRMHRIGIGAGAKSKR